MARRRRRTGAQRLALCERHNWQCCLCPVKIDPVNDRWILEHIIALENGGSDEDSNIAPAHEACAIEKTRGDLKSIAKGKRIRARHLGAHLPRRPMVGSRRHPSGLRRHLDGSISHWPTVKDPSLFGAPLPRLCRGCLTTKPMEAFKTDRSRKDGHAYVCSDCERLTPFDLPNVQDRIAARDQGEAWCRECKGWRPLADSGGNGLCREHQRIENRQRYATNPLFRAKVRRHTLLRKRGVEPVPETISEYLTEMFEGQCAYCDSPATAWDHVHPVSKGGLTAPDNILPACVQCNSSKRDRDLIEWLDATGREMKCAAWERLAFFQVLEF